MYHESTWGVEVVLCTSLSVALDGDSSVLRYSVTVGK